MQGPFPGPFAANKATAQIRLNTAKVAWPSQPENHASTGQAYVNLQEAADRLGVHYQTLYRWVRAGQITAVKNQTSYEVTEEEIDRFVARRAVPTTPPERVAVRSWENQRKQLYDALVTGEELEARAITDRLHDMGVPLLELCEELLSPTMRMVGEAWHEGVVSVAQEHRATAIAERLLARVSTNPRGRPRGTAVVVSAPGDQHSLPGAMAALVLRDDRWRVHHLGSALPASELIDFAASVNTDLVVVSVTSHQGTEDADGHDDQQNIQSLVQALRCNGHRVLLGAPGRTLSELVGLARSADDSLVR